MPDYEFGDQTFDLNRPIVDADGDEWMSTGLKNQAGAPTFSIVGMPPEEGWPLNLVQFQYGPLTQD